MKKGFWALDGVSNGELEKGLLDLLAAGGRTDARIVAHLAEVDARRLHLLGGRSLFEYCLVRLGLSESEAFYRICAARAGRRFPVVFELLGRRELHLTTVALIAKRLTPENHLELLAEVRGKSKREVLEVLARRWPREAVASHLRRLPVRSGMVAAGPSGTLEPLADDSYCLQLHVDAALREKLELARDLMSHANPSGDLAVVVARALDALLDRLRARRFGQPKRLMPTRDSGRERGRHCDSRDRKPEVECVPARAATNARAHENENENETRRERETEARRLGEVATKREHEAATSAGEPSSPPSDEAPRRRRHVAHAVRRQVWERDGVCCSYVSPDGHRCGERAFLELDHRQAWAKGGVESVENLRVLCRAHNRLRAEREFGVRLPGRTG